MSKQKSRKTGSAGKSTSRKPRAAKPVDSPAVSRRLVLRSTAAAGIAIAGGTWLHFHDTRTKALHDLSVIGTGQPVVLQVHDPSCPSCRKLKGSTETALKSFPDIEYRIADLTTSAGRRISDEYQVGKVTLLLFDGRGKHVETVQGVTTVEVLSDTFRRTFDL